MVQDVRLDGKDPGPASPRFDDIQVGAIEINGVGLVANGITPSQRGVTRRSVDRFAVEKVATIVGLDKFFDELWRDESFLVSHVSGFVRHKFLVDGESLVDASPVVCRQAGKENENQGNDMPEVVPKRHCQRHFANPPSLLHFMLVGGYLKRDS